MISVEKQTLYIFFLKSAFFGMFFGSGRVKNEQLVIKTIDLDSTLQYLHFDILVAIVQIILMKELILITRRDQRGVPNFKVKL